MAPLQADPLVVHHLAALTGLTSLIYSNNDHMLVDAVRAIAQLTRLRRLELRQPSTFTEIQLAQLSALSRLTCLEMNGGVFLAGHPHMASVTILFTNLFAAARCMGCCSAYVQPCAVNMAIVVPVHQGCRCCSYREAESQHDRQLACCTGGRPGAAAVADSASCYNGW